VSTYANTSANNSIAEAILLRSLIRSLTCGRNSIYTAIHLLFVELVRLSALGAGRSAGFIIILVYIDLAQLFLLISFQNSLPYPLISSTKRLSSNCIINLASRTYLEFTQVGCASQFVASHVTHAQMSPLTWVLFWSPMYINMCPKALLVSFSHVMVVPDGPLCLKSDSFKNAHFHPWFSLS
jgi:hypothetical protein